jgi:hypothetical protein
MGSPSENFSTTYHRVWKAEFLRSELSKYTSLKNGEQCIESDVQIIKDIAAGCFGSIHLAYLSGQPFALKKTIEKMTKDAIEHAYDPRYEAWREINFLKPFLNSIVEKGICPNLPYIYSNLICNTCNFKLTVGKKITDKKNTPCNTIIMELASGTLEKWIETPKDEDRQYACFFQCMAGIHAIQKYFQMSNRDIKSINILYKECQPGGYWEYVIQGKTYYIPNYGEVLLVNDYGVGMSFDSSFPPICTKFAPNRAPKGALPSLKSLRIGLRPFVITDGKFTSINYTGAMPGVSKYIHKKITPPLIVKDNVVKTAVNTPVSVVLSDEQKSVLTKHGIPTDVSDPMFFSDPHVVPFLDMYVDTQDMIRTICGKFDRTVQDGTHSDLNFSKKLKDELSPYVYPVKDLELKNIREGILTPANTIAGYFITDFFNKRFNTRPSGELLQRFII